MATATAATNIRIIEELADGRWHDRDRLIAIATPLVHPGQASRRAEVLRQRQSASKWRVKNHDRTMEIGARRLILDRLRSQVYGKKIEQRTLKDGRVQLRLTRQYLKEVRSDPARFAIGA